MIDLDPDAYGTHAPHSAIADFLEIQALQHGQSWSLGDVSDQLLDLGFGRRALSSYADASHLLRSAENDTEEKTGSLQDVCHEHANVVFNTLQQRKRILSNVYPFEINSTRLVFDAEWRNQPYIQALCLTVIHAWKLESEFKPTETFPTWVAESLRSQGLIATEIPGASNLEGQYSIRVRKAALSLGLPINLEGVLVSRRAQDEGTDVIAVWRHRDERHCQWYCVGQVTCGKSDSWLRKAREVSAGKWKEISGNQIEPGKFLAVPHHVSDEQFEYLAQDGHVILDRLRVVPFLKGSEVMAKAAKQSVKAAQSTAP